MVQMGKSQCLSDREFPEFFKTHLTFDSIGFLRGVMGHLKQGARFADRGCILFLSSYNYHEVVLFQKAWSTRSGPRRISLHYHNVPYKQSVPVKRKTCFPEAIKEVVTHIHNRNTKMYVYDYSNQPNSSHKNFLWVLFFCEWFNTLEIMSSAGHSEGQVKIRQWLV